MTRRFRKSPLRWLAASPLPFPFPLTAGRTAVDDIATPEIGTGPGLATRAPLPLRLETITRCRRFVRRRNKTIPVVVQKKQTAPKATSRSCVNVETGIGTEADDVMEPDSALEGSSPEMPPAKPSPDT